MYKYWKTKFNRYKNFTDILDKAALQTVYYDIILRLESRCKLNKVED